MESAQYRAARSCAILVLVGYGRPDYDGRPPTIPGAVFLIGNTYFGRVWR